MIYLVDYENVNLNGMVGIENLEESDHVVVFLGNNTGAIPFEWHIRIVDSKAHVKYIKCGKVSKNYLDFQLATFCGYIMATLEHEKVYVVSKDKGFDSIVDFWTENKEDVEIVRIEAIDESLGIPRPMNKEKIRNQKQKKQNGKKGNKKNKNRQDENSSEVVVAEAVQKMEEILPTVQEEAEQKEAVEVIEEPEVTEEPQPEAEVEIVEEPYPEAEVEIVEEPQPEAEEEIVEEAAVPKKSTKKESQPEKVNKLSESTKKHIRQKIKDEQLNGGNYKTIYNIFMTQRAKNRFNTALVKAFQQEQGNRIYKKLLSEFEAHIKSQEEA